MITHDDLRAALARGYCTRRNFGKVVDPVLVEDMAAQVMQLLVDRRVLSASRAALDAKHGEDLEEGSW